jgi:hypothetical protein
MKIKYKWNININYENTSNNINDQVMLPPEYITKKSNGLGTVKDFKTINKIKAIVEKGIKEELENSYGVLKISF